MLLLSLHLRLSADEAVVEGPEKLLLLAFPLSFARYVARNVGTRTLFAIVAEFKENYERFHDYRKFPPHEYFFIYTTEYEIFPVLLSAFTISAPHPPP